MLIHPQELAQGLLSRTVCCTSKDPIWLLEIWDLRSPKSPFEMLPAVEGVTRPERLPWLVGLSREQFRERFGDCGAAKMAVVGVSLPMPTVEVVRPRGRFIMVKTEDGAA